MNKQNFNLIKKVFIYILIYAFISSVIIYFNLNRRYLIFNAGLSFIPYIVSSFGLLKKNNYLILILSLLLTLIFYPNAIYMFTDFIHIKTSQYYTYSLGEVHYIMDFINWIKLGVDVSMIFLSLVLSFETFINILKMIRCYGYKIASFIILLGLCFANSVAVYIGRFLRFNSWDIFKIKEILINILENKTTNDSYLIATFAIVQFLIIIILANAKSE